MSKQDRPLYVGFDLGTTNSAAAIFDGEESSVVRSSGGALLTPSVVRIDARGRVTVGDRARRFLERDPANTRAEFKRLMGTDTALPFEASATTRTPVQLSAEVLRTLRSDVEDACGSAPTCAVISVPALFELPQSSATSKAAELAGFERVELLQEPIASALAAGWSAEDDAGYWLVYDLGGGTFDASLLETAEGFLRVVGHDGDNFLGGRDFDWAIVDWALEALKLEGVHISRAEAEHRAALGVLKEAAEDAKIQLTRSKRAALHVPELRVGESVHEVDLELDRDTLEARCGALIERSLEVCTRLLAEHRVDPGQLSRVVLVGGPTMMPFLRDRVGERLGAPVAEGVDPMTLVAQGSAIYAATANLDARPATAKPEEKGRRLWLQHPAVSSDLEPCVVGRVLPGEGAAPKRLRLRRDDGWTSEASPVDPDGGFVLPTVLRARSPNVFTVLATDGDGAPVEVSPASLTIVQGLTISDPPLSRSIGVALASDLVRVYVERGTPLPARRTFTHHTVESVAKGTARSVLRIPIVQGEYEQAHLCREVGCLEIRGEDIRASLPAGAEIELTIEVDRGGQLSARALVPTLDQAFDGVAHLLVPDADPAALESALEDLRTRIDAARADAFKRGATKVLADLGRAGPLLDRVAIDLQALRGGDEDAGQRARRNLVELDGQLDAIEERGRWPELQKRTVEVLTWASRELAERGTPREQRLFEEIGDAIERARMEHDHGELERQLRLANSLGEAAYFRDPNAWEWMFEMAASRVDESSDLPRAHALVREGKDLLARDDRPGLRRVVEKLWRLLPEDPTRRRLGFDSGVR